MPSATTFPVTQASAGSARKASQRRRAASPVSARSRHRRTRRTRSRQADCRALGCVGAPRWVGQDFQFVAFFERADVAFAHAGDDDRLRPQRLLAQSLNQRLNLDRPPARGDADTEPRDRQRAIGRAREVNFALIVREPAELGTGDLVVDAMLRPARAHADVIQRSRAGRGRRRSAHLAGLPAAAIAPRASNTCLRERRRGPSSRFSRCRGTRQRRTTENSSSRRPLPDEAVAPNSVFTHGAEPLENGRSNGKTSGRLGKALSSCRPERGRRAPS